MLKPTVIAAPLFALLIAIEAFISARNNSNYYEKKDAWTNIGLGFFSLIWGAALAIIIVTTYEFVFQYAFFTIDMLQWWHWVILIVLDDLAYYWFHRYSHEKRFLWNLHVVHHSSQRYNLSVAVRQSWFSGIANWIFYIPLALIGFPYWAFAISHGINLIYQFWIHTEYVKKMGKFEYIFNTPSQHRVHHAINPQYLDKNYGGIFCVWDRLFGTYKEEDEKPQYGLLTQLKSHNLMWVNTHAWIETWQTAKRAKTLKDKFKCYWGSPYMSHVPPVTETTDSSTEKK